MVSDAVNKILSAEQLADRQNAEARRKAEDIVASAEQQAVIAVQKKLAMAKSETEKIRKSDSEKLAEYSRKAEKECDSNLEAIRITAEKNTETAVNAVIAEFFS